MQSQLCLFPVDGASARAFDGQLNNAFVWSVTSVTDLQTLLCLVSFKELASLYVMV